MKQPEGERYVRVIRTHRKSWPVTHPTNPNMDTWESTTNMKLCWVPESQVDPKTDEVVVDL